MLKTVVKKTFDEERALYGAENIRLEDCVFDGPADGESALKESSGVEAVNCDFRLRYPLWHVRGGSLRNCRMTQTCRAALWYCRDISAENCEMNGIKALRECDGTVIGNCSAESPEFGWLCRGIKISDSSLVSEYPFFMSRNITADNFRMKGKYSFQYAENVVITNSYLDTKDAFWHSRNVTVTDSVIKGEYLAWYSEGLRLIRCKIIGTQPLCYAKGLVLEDCETEGCDLAFERSEVNATLKGHIDSIKNPVSGRIEVSDVGEIILEKGFDGCEINVMGR